MRARHRRRGIGAALLRAALVALLVTTSIAACEDPAGVEREGVEVTPRQNGVELENRRERAVYYFLADQEELALLDWLPCRDPQTCAGVDPDERLLVPKSEVIGWGESDVLVVFWWELRRQANGEYEPQEFNSVRVGY